MSAFISSVATGNPILRTSDARAVTDQYRLPMWDLVLYTGPTALGLDDWRTGWWPARGFTLGDGGMGEMMVGAKYRRYWPSSGCNGRLAFVGVTRDQYGTAIGGCTVRCFRASTCELVSTVTSNALTGAYVATTPYSDAHFLTVHRASAPAVAGASIDTITPA